MGVGGEFTECRIIQNEYGPLDIFQFVRQRWRHFVIYPRKFRRGRGRRTQLREKTARIRCVGSKRVALEIGPVGDRLICLHG